MNGIAGCNHRVLGLLAVLSVNFASPRAFGQPSPVFLPGGQGSEAIVAPPGVGERKKDSRVSVAGPVLRGFSGTIFNVHTHEAEVLETSPSSEETLHLRRLLRDRTNWNEHTISPAVIATLRAAVTAFGARRVEIVSGYRSDKMNEMLRKKGRHVARQSQHVLGNAVDFRLVGVPFEALLAFVRRVHVGGVGAYRHSGFVHVDAGRARRWRGE